MIGIDVNNHDSALRPPAENVSAMRPKDSILTAIPVEESQDLLSAREDKYFDNKADVIAVFDYDYPTLEEVTVQDLSFRINHARKCIIVSNLYFIFTILLNWNSYSVNLIAVHAPFFFVNVLIWINSSQALQDVEEKAHYQVYSQHLCITQQGIVSVRGTRAGASETVEIVSWDTVVKVTLERFTALPSVTVFHGGKSCWFQKKLVIKGLRNPRKFIESVQQMIPNVKDASSGTEDVLLM
jgi:hypothetical protein